MSLTQWKTFVEVCRAGSLRAAAESTGFTQPGVSRQVAALERTVGVRLLQRGARGVTPTAAGTALLPHARMVVNEARRGAEAARAAQAHPAALIVGAVPSASASLLPRVLGEMLAAGGPRCSVVTALTAQLATSVLTRELDAAIITDAPPGLPRDPDLRLRHLGNDEMVVLVAKDHRLATRERVEVAEFTTETWIEDNAGSEALLRGLTARAGFEPRLSLSADALLTKTGLVAAGFGVALAPDSLVPALRPDIAVVRLEHPVRRGIYLLTRRDRDGLDDLVDALANSAWQQRTA